MKKWVLIAGCFFLAVSTAFGAGSIISSFRSPSSYVMGLGYHSPYIYHSDYSGTRIHQTTTTGSVVRTIPGRSGILGVDFTGTYFWICCYTSPYYIYQLTSAGSVVRSFSGLAAGYGCTFDGTYVWVSSARSYNVYRFTTTGSFVTSFRGPGSFPGGLDWANGYLWLGDWPSSGAGIFRLTTTGSVVESYRPVPSGGRSAGVAWDGSYIWYSDYSNSYIYQMDTVLTSVVPASVGKIKSIYR